MTAIRFNLGRAQVLDLGSLEEGLPGITPRVGAFLAEAAITCLEQECHTPNVQMVVDGDCDERFSLRWAESGDPEQRARAWGDAEKATENGACGIAALLVVEMTDYTIVEMAKRGPGFDYWLGRKGHSSPLFQDKARLEVSGVRRGDDAVIEARVRRKMRQIEPSDGGLPGVVAVVEFGSPKSRVKSK